MDLAGEALAFGEPAGFALAGGEFVAGADQVVDELLAGATLAVERGVAVRGEQGDGGAGERAEDLGGGEAAGGGGLGGDHDAGEQGDGRQRPARWQDVQADEVQREGEVAEFGVLEGERDPQQDHGAEPEAGPQPGVADAVCHAPRRVDGREHAGCHQAARSEAAAHESPDEQDTQQGEEQPVQGEVHQPQGRGVGRVDGTLWCGRFGTGHAFRGYGVAAVVRPAAASTVRWIFGCIPRWGPDALLSLMARRARADRVGGVLTVHFPEGPRVRRTA